MVGESAIDAGHWWLACWTAGWMHVLYLSHPVNDSAAWTNRERKLRVCNCTAHALHLKQALLQWFPIRRISFVTWFECGFTWLHWSVMFIVLHSFSHSCTVYRNISLVVQMCKCFYYYCTIGTVVYVLHLFFLNSVQLLFTWTTGESWVAMLCFELKGSCWCCARHHGL